MVEAVDPRPAGARHLLALSDAYMQAPYPAQSNHLEGSEALAQPHGGFIGIHAGHELVACGAVQLMQDDGCYGEIKRVFVLPAHRGQAFGPGIAGVRPAVHPLRCLAGSPGPQEQGESCAEHSWPPCCRSRRRQPMRRR